MKTATSCRSSPNPCRTGPRSSWKLFSATTTRYHLAPASPKGHASPTGPTTHFLSPAPGFWGGQLQLPVQGFRRGAELAGQPHRPGDQRGSPRDVAPRTSRLTRRGPAHLQAHGKPRPLALEPAHATGQNSKPFLLAAPFRPRPPTGSGLPRFRPPPDHAP